MVGRPRGFAFPSIFALIYASTFGYIALLALARSRGTAAILISMACALTASLIEHKNKDDGLSMLFSAIEGLQAIAFWIELLLPLSRGDATVTRS